MESLLLFLSLYHVFAAPGTFEAPGPGPCDILLAAGNPCVAAHSTVRALSSTYNGPLYNVTRLGDGKSSNIGLLSTGGFADKASHDKFCSKLDCVISNVFDQTENANHLGQRHKLINASRHSVTVGKDKTAVYGMWCVCNNSPMSPQNHARNCGKHSVCGTWCANSSPYLSLSHSPHLAVSRARLYLYIDSYTPHPAGLILASATTWTRRPGLQRATTPSPSTQS